MPREQPKKWQKDKKQTNKKKQNKNNWRRKTDTICYHLYVECIIQHKWTYQQNRNRLTDLENRFVIARKHRGWSGMNWEFGVGRCKLLHLEWISNEVPLYITGNYIQSLEIDNDRRCYKKRNTHTHTHTHTHTRTHTHDWVTLQQKLAQHCKSTIL